MRAKRVFKARVRRTGIDEERVAKLPHISQPLQRRRVHQCQRERIESDVVPERIANDFHVRHPVKMRRGRPAAGRPRRKYSAREMRQPFGPAFAIAADT